MYASLQQNFCMDIFSNDPHVFVFHYVFYFVRKETRAKDEHFKPIRAVIGKLMPDPSPFTIDGIPLLISFTIFSFSIDHSSSSPFLIDCAISPDSIKHDLATLFTSENIDFL